MVQRSNLALIIQEESASVSWYCPRDSYTATCLKATSGRKTILFLCVIFGAVLVCNTLKQMDAVQCGSLSYWCLNLLPVAVAALAMVLIRIHLLEQHRRKVQARYQFEKGDMQWDRRSTIVYPLVCALSGKRGVYWTLPVRGFCWQGSLLDCLGLEEE